MLLSSHLMDVLGLQHGDSAIIENIEQIKPYTPIQNIHITLSNCPNAVALPLIQLSKLEKEYCLSDLIHLYYNSQFLSPQTQIILPVVDAYLQGHIDSVEPLVGGVLTASSSIVFHISEKSQSQPYYHVSAETTRYLKAIQSSIHQLPINSNAIQVRGMIVYGGVGSGKTSLLKYISNAINKTDEMQCQPKSALFVSSSSFPYSDPFCILDTTPSLRVLCIDDVDEMSEG